MRSADLLPCSNIPVAHLPLTFSPRDGRFFFSFLFRSWPREQNVAVAVRAPAQPSHGSWDSPAKGPDGRLDPHREARLGSTSIQRHCHDGVAGRRSRVRGVPYVRLLYMSSPVPYRVLCTSKVLPSLGVGPFPSPRPPQPDVVFDAMHTLLPAP